MWCYGRHVQPGNGWLSSCLYYKYNSGYSDSYQRDGIGGVRPIFVLNKNVEISGGTGTYGDPYTLTIEQ